ncbi:mitochondrial hypothetical protein [Talaromyces pinophilus]|uniref:Uncharacterized protein n=1 Tax=Talaromyces pinophilus TaxID=128442 RepID=A0A478EC49_TALPI|nr:mitochondrial hypothetical protein [Talaromyces pinophilus]
MSKLSPALKALINAPNAQPGTIPAPAQIASVYANIAKEAEPRNVGLKAWFSAATAATMTMNSPESLVQLHKLVSESKSKEESVYLAELIREIGLKCIGFDGIPRTINCLGEFRAGLPTDIADALATQPRRNLTPEVIPDILNRGNSLWKSIYYPFESKLQQKLALSHPDLPAFEDKTAESETEIQGGEWLASDEGSVWLIGVVDRIVESIGGVQGGTSFAPGLRGKL